MQQPNGGADADRKRNRRRTKKPPPHDRTAIWSDDGTVLLAVVDGHVTPDDIAAARQLALRATAPQ